MKRTQNTRLRGMTSPLAPLRAIPILCCWLAACSGGDPSEGADVGSAADVDDGAPTFEAAPEDPPVNVEPHDPGSDRQLDATAAALAGLPASSVDALSDPGAREPRLPEDIEKSLAATDAVRAEGAVIAGGCVLGICGTIINHTSGVVGTAKDWCDDRDGPCSNTQYGVLQPGQSTPGNQDWDTWFTPSGCVDVGFSLVPGLGQVPWVVTGGWHKVYTPEDAHIVTRSC